MVDMDIAEVVLTHGRYFLRVAGVYIAMETDLVLCRDPHIESRYWDKVALDQAATEINRAISVAVGARPTGEGGTGE